MCFEKCGYFGTKKRCLESERGINTKERERERMEDESALHEEFKGAAKYLVKSGVTLRGSMKAARSANYRGLPGG